MCRSPLKAPGWWALGDQCSSSWVIVPKHSSHVPCSSQTAAAMSILGHSWDKTLLWDTVEEHSLETRVCATLLHEGLFLQHSGSTQLQNRGQSVVNVTDPGGFDKANRIQSNESPVGACKALSVCPVVERSHGQSIIQLEKDIYAWHILTLRLVLDTLPSKMSSWAWCFMTCRPHMCIYIYINRHTIPYDTIPLHYITLHCIYTYIHIYISIYIYTDYIHNTVGNLICSSLGPHWNRGKAGKTKRFAGTVQPREEEVDVSRLWFFLQGIPKKWKFYEHIPSGYVKIAIENGYL